MPMCPIIAKQPDCLRKACELWVHETQMCCFVDIAIDLQFVASMRDVIERMVKVIEADAGTLETLETEVEDKEND